MINPNDPEQNTEMFSVDPPQPEATTNLRTGVEPSRNETRSRRTTFNAYHQQRNAGASYGEQNPTRSGGQPPSKPERGGVENSPFHSQAKVGGRVGLAYSSFWKKKQAENNHGLAPRTPGRIRHFKLKSPEGVAAVPKFGGWDGNDSASADGYSCIFRKAMEEKQSGGGNLDIPTGSTLNRPKSTYSEKSKRFRNASRTSNRGRNIREESREEITNPDFSDGQDEGNPSDMFASANIINRSNFENSSDSSEDQSEPRSPDQHGNIDTKITVFNFPKMRRWFRLWLKK